MGAAFDAFYELAEKRYSVRKFSSRAVEREKVEQILQVGRIAPTACNRQPQRILVLDSAENLQKLKKCTTSHFHCTLAMLVSHDTDACWKREYDGKSSGDIDAAIVTTHLMLAASALGIGSTWVMHFMPEAVRSAFELPENYEPSSLLVMGYPSADAEPFPGHASKKALTETVFYQRFER